MVDSSRLKVLSVGSNSISAFLSWRLTASNAADVSLIWKSHYEIVMNYGIAFKSQQLGPGRLRPFQVSKSIDDVRVPEGGFDYILLCVKALPDVYDLGSVIERVVTPGHTCIVVNTSTGIGIESYLESAFKENVILSLVCDSKVSQIGPAEFEQSGTDAAQYWIGCCTKTQPTDPTTIDDMADSLALTLEAGVVKCAVSKNIRQQQWEKSIGPIALHSLSVIMEEPNLSSLILMPRMRANIAAVIDELILIARSQRCSFDSNFARRVLETTAANPKPSMMYQDYLAKRPMEVEVMVGNPLKIADDMGLKVPRLEMVYLTLSRLNEINQSRGAMATPIIPAVPSRQPSNMSLAAAARRAPVQNGTQAAPPRRPASSQNGHVSRKSISRRSSMEGLEEFSDVVAYSSTLPSPVNNGSEFAAPGKGKLAGSPSLQDLTLREREMELRQREIAIREQEYAMQQRQRGMRPSMTPGGIPNRAPYAGGDYFSGPAQPPVEVDMVAYTSQRNRRTSNVGGRTKNESMTNGGGGVSGAFQRLMRSGRKQSMTPDQSSVGVDYYDSLTSSVADYTSDRYHEVDSRVLADSRANSMSSNAPRPSLYHHSQSLPIMSPQMGRSSAMLDSAPPAPPNSRFRYASNPRAMHHHQQQQQYMPPPMQARKLSSLVGPSPMDAMMTAAFGQGSPSSSSSSSVRGVPLPRMSAPPPPPQQMMMRRTPESTSPEESDSELYAAAAAVGGKDHGRRRRSLTGSASASASTSNDNGSGNSSSASSLEQK
ncbi:ketopantoate reductase PanE/ApbA C terminal-domain-containing protein [Myxozyma melibiosi]|uniref:Ketopantoate reductase PanE/ApbA C terminal-domain-containing protein n=1 Tax=Myxozyma melibiosi TaxID=54550 RepID=A0ABR1FE33_9ASCO